MKRNLLITVLALFVCTSGMYFFAGTNTGNTTLSNNVQAFNDLKTAGDGITTETISQNVTALSDGTTTLESNVNTYLQSKTSSSSTSSSSSRTSGSTSSSSSSSTSGTTGTTTTGTTIDPDYIISQATARASSFMTYSSTATGYYTQSFTVGKYTNEEIINNLVGRLQAEHDNYGNTVFRIEYVGTQDVYGTMKWVFKVYRG